MNHTMEYVKDGLPLGMGCPICDIGQLYMLTGGASAWGVNEFAWAGCELCGDYQVGEERLDGLADIKYIEEQLNGGDSNCIEEDCTPDQPKDWPSGNLLFI